MKRLVSMLPKMVTSGVCNTRTKTGVAGVRIMRIYFRRASKKRKNLAERVSTREMNERYKKKFWFVLELRARRRRRGTQKRRRGFADNRNRGLPHVLNCR